MMDTSQHEQAPAAAAAVQGGGQEQATTSAGQQQQVHQEQPSGSSGPATSSGSTQVGTGTSGENTSNANTAENEKARIKAEIEAIVAEGTGSIHKLLELPESTRHALESVTVTFVELLILQEYLYRIGSLGMS